MIHSITLKEEPSSLTSQVKKFIRRKDLTAEIRLKIATLALFFSVQGGITGLALRHGISRTFVYQLVNQLENNLELLFGAPSSVPLNKQSLFSLAVKHILMLRLAGRCSISAISGLLEAWKMPVSSTGFISQTLQRTGAALPSIIQWQGPAIYASDEIFFSGHCPILVTVDIVSGAILHIEKRPVLTKEAWEKHWKRLKDKGIELVKLLSDEGTVMRAARQSLGEVHWQPDTFHAISHRLGVFMHRLGRQAEKALEQEYGRQERQINAKSPKTQQKSLRQYQQAAQTFLKAGHLLDDFRFLYHCILEQNDVFLPNGQVRPRSYAEAEVRTAIQCMRSLAIPGLDKELDEIEKTLPDLYAFLDCAEQAMTHLSQQIDPQLLPFWTGAWQYEKKARKAKYNYSFQKRSLAKSALALELLREHYQMEEEAFLALQQTIFRFLDGQTAQSSAMVETVNSFIRPFLDESRDQISQETLNLVMFYYNHRPFERGKRKGKAPIEILTGKPLEKNWLDLLLEAAAKQ